MDTRELINAGDGLKLAIPLTWKRNAVVAFSNGHEGEEAASVVVRRESLDPRITLQQYADSVLIELARTLPTFTLMERRQRTLGGEPAVEMIYTLTARGDEYEQRQTCTLDIPGSVLSVVLSSTKKHARDAQPLWESILASATLYPPT